MVLLEAYLLAKSSKNKKLNKMADDGMLFAKKCAKKMKKPIFDKKQHRKSNFLGF